MQKFLLVFALMTSLTSTFAQRLDLQDDVLVPTNGEQDVVTGEALKAQKQDFIDFITKFKSDMFVGHSQYVFSALNLSQKSHIKYAKEENGTVLFQMATNGNRWVTAGDVTYPMQGKVYFELKKADGEYLEFMTKEDDTRLTFKGKKNTLYIVETESAFETRKTVQAKQLKGQAPVGRFFAKVEYDLFTQNIEFYEIETNCSRTMTVEKQAACQAENMLVRRGTFQGNVAPQRTGF